MILGTALALMFSAANVFLRDVSNAVNVLSNFVRFGVPMMYPYALVAQRFHGHTAIYLLEPDRRGGARLPARFWVGATSHPAHTARIDMPPHLFWLADPGAADQPRHPGVRPVDVLRLERRIPERLL